MEATARDLARCCRAQVLAAVEISLVGVEARRAEQLAKGQCFVCPGELANGRKNLTDPKYRNYIINT